MQSTCGLEGGGGRGRETERERGGGGGGGLGGIPPTPGPAPRRCLLVNSGGCGSALARRFPNASPVLGELCRSTGEYQAGLWGHNAEPPSPRWQGSTQLLSAQFTPHLNQGGGEVRAERGGRAAPPASGPLQEEIFTAVFLLRELPSGVYFFFSEGIKMQSALCPAEDGHLRGFYERRISADGRHAAFQTRAWHGPRAPTPGTLTAMGSGVATRSELPPSRKALLSL